MFVLLLALPGGIEWLIILGYLFLIVYAIRKSYQKFDKGGMSLARLILLILLTVFVPVIGPIVTLLAV